MPEPVMTLDNVEKTFGAFRLGPLSLTIEPGYVVAVVGPNGSGKSTLFRMLMGLVHPDAGDIRLFGQSRTDADRDIAIAARIGYVPERSLGHDRMTVDDLGRFTARWYPEWDSARYESAIEAMGVERDKRFSTLSKGLQRRVAFALAQASNPDLLLCDELTDGVDPFARREILADIVRFMEAGDRTVVYATHNLDEVRRLADYVVFIVDGACLGMYEKDALVDGWRRIWVERPPAVGTPGVVADGRRPARELVSGEWRETMAALEAQGIGVERVAPLELTDILEHLMANARGAPAGDPPSPVPGR